MNINKNNNNQMMNINKNNNNRMIIINNNNQKMNNNNNNKIIKQDKNQMNNKITNNQANIQINNLNNMKQNSLDIMKRTIINSSQLILKNSIKTLSDKTKILNSNKNLPKKKKLELSKEEIEEMKECFDSFDTKGIGKIELKELKNSLESLDIDKNNNTFNKMIKEINILENQGKQFIVFEEFVYLMSADDCNGNTKEDLKQTFDLFTSKDNPNVITFNSLKKASKEIGENLSDEELRDMMFGKNEITFEEFCEIMKK